MAGQPTAGDVAGWAGERAVVAERIGRHVARSDPRERPATSAGCSATPSGRTAGSWPSTSATRPPTAGSTCPPGPTGTPTRCATNSSATSAAIGSNKTLFPYSSASPSTLQRQDNIATHNLTPAAPGAGTGRAPHGPPLWGTYAR